MMSASGEAEDAQAMAIPRGPQRRRAMRGRGLEIGSADFTDEERAHHWSMRPLPEDVAGVGVPDASGPPFLHGVCPVRHQTWAAAARCAKT